MINKDYIINCIGLDFIGIRGYCEEVSTSGYWLDDLVGINLKGGALVAREDDLNAEGLFNRILRNGITETASEFLEALRDSANLEFQLGTNNKCYTLTKNRALKITAKDQVKRIYIEKAELNGSGKIFIHDNEGNLVEVAEAGTYIDIKFKGLGETLYIYVHTEALTITEEVRECKGCFYNYCDCGAYTTEELELEGLTGEEENLFYIGARCSYEALICSYKDLLARAIYYRSAAFFMIEKWQSGNLDPYITGSKEHAERLYHEYYYGYEGKPSTYTKALTSAVRAAKKNLINLNTDCFNCRGIKVVPIKL